MPTILVTGSSGLVGSEAVLHFAERDWKVIGIDNNMRRHFFGRGGDTTLVREYLTATLGTDFQFYNIDIRQASKMTQIMHEHRPDAIIHAAAQPAHEYGELNPRENWSVNVEGTLNVLDAVRTACPKSPFVFMSSSKVYGTMESIPFKEGSTRYDFERMVDMGGIDESLRIDQTTHTQYGASKLAADILVQEYGRGYNMNTVCFRAGCMTGARHAGVPMHGFLSNLVRTIQDRKTYTVYGFRGKQVRDQLHASDVMTACEYFINQPAPGGLVYNLGGGRRNSVSILEAIEMIEADSQMEAILQFEDKPRHADQICLINDSRRFHQGYGWRPRVGVQAVISELVDAHAKVGAV